MGFKWRIGGESVRFRGVNDQVELFEMPGSWPEGFRYDREWISRESESELVDEIRGLPFEDFQFHGYVGRRRTVSFGWRYDFGGERLMPAGEIPSFLLPLREAAAGFARVAPDDLAQILVTEYGAEAGIGWHRDKVVFGDVVGVSLLSGCRFRLRRNVGGRWERCTVDVEPRSVYLLSGAARSEWEHSIPPVSELRYSVTFRCLRG